MSAGLPGLGLGGLFFIVSALLAPFVELYRTARGRSSAGAWRNVGRQFAIAAVMIVAIDVALRLAFLAVEATGIGEGPADRGLTVLPVAPIGITLGLLAALLATAKAVQLALRIPHGLAAIRPVATRPVRAPGRVLAGAALALSAWFALLAVGASDLSPISGGGERSGRDGEERLVETPPSPTDRETEGGPAESSAAPVEAPSAAPVTRSEPPAVSPDGARGSGPDERSPGAPGAGDGDGPGATEPATEPGSPQPTPAPETPAADPSTPAPSEGEPPGNGPPEDPGPPSSSEAQPDAGPPPDRDPGESSGSG